LWFHNRKWEKMFLGKKKKQGRKTGQKKDNSRIQSKRRVNQQRDATKISPAHLPQEKVKKKDGVKREKNGGGSNSTPLVWGH